MAVFAEGLQVVPVPEQRRVPLVRLDVVNVFAGITAEGTDRVQAQELGPQGFPLARIAALAAVRALCVMPALAGANGGALAGAKRTSRDDSTTGTEARRRWHIRCLGRAARL